MVAADVADNAQPRLRIHRERHARAVVIGFRIGNPHVRVGAGNFDEGHRILLREGRRREQQQTQHEQGNPTHRFLLTGDFASGSGARIPWDGRAEVASACSQAA